MFKNCIRNIKNHHYINRGDSMDDVIWKLFKETGDIKYYILLRNMNKRSDEFENRGDRGNNTK